MKTLTLAAALTALSFAQVIAGHANPWATEADSVLEKNHDANQAKSVNAPGEDEMRGNMAQRAWGKLGNTVGAGSTRGRNK